jgi:hypothetical protein
VLHYSLSSFCVFASQRFRITLRLAVYRPSVSICAKALVTHDQYFFSTERLRLSLRNIISSLTRVWVCWSSPAQSFSGPSPSGLMTIFYCLRLELPQPGGSGPRICISQEQSGPVIPPGTWFPFRRVLRLVGRLCLCL